MPGSDGGFGGLSFVLLILIVSVSMAGFGTGFKGRKGCGRLGLSQVRQGMVWLSTYFS